MTSEKKHGTVLITGGSTGIGFELARVFAGEGYEIILVAKNPERLERAAATLRRDFHVTVTALTSDLAQGAGPQKLYDDVKQKFLHVDILVNNAGHGDYGKFSESDLEKELQMMQLNMVSLVRLSKLFLKDMVKHNRGRILNVASTAAFQPGPFMAIYYATKAFVLSFSEAVNSELKGTGVTVTTLCPGPTESNFSKVANIEGNKLFKAGVMDAPSVARIAYKALMKDRSVVIPGFRNRLLAASVRFFPRDLVTFLSRKAVEMPG